MALGLLPLDTIRRRECTLAESGRVTGTQHGAASVAGVSRAVTFTTAVRVTYSNQNPRKHYDQ